MARDISNISIDPMYRLSTLLTHIFIIIIITQKLILSQGMGCRLSKGKVAFNSRNQYGEEVKGLKNYLKYFTASS